jgi:hypothetical protein
MSRAKRPVLATVLASTLIFTSVAPSAAVANQLSIDNRPGELAMIGDAFIARPLLLGSTLLGIGVFAVSLPVSLLGGNEAEAAEKLVAAPARSTFIRCLGCTPAQNTQTQAQRRTERAERKAAATESNAE